MIQIVAERYPRDEEFDWYWSDLFDYYRRTTVTDIKPEDYLDSFGNLRELSGQVFHELIAQGWNVIIDKEKINLS